MDDIIRSSICGLSTQKSIENVSSICHYPTNIAVQHGTLYGSRPVCNMKGLGS